MDLIDVRNRVYFYGQYFRLKDNIRIPRPAQRFSGYSSYLSWFSSLSENYTSLRTARLSIPIHREARPTFILKMQKYEINARAIRYLLYQLDWSMV